MIDEVNHLLKICKPPRQAGYIAYMLLVVMAGTSDIFMCRYLLVVRIK